MLEYLLLVVALLGAALRRHRDLVAENLLLRQQLTVLTRPTRKRPRLRRRDRLFWVLARSLRRDWRRHLLLVRRATVIGWHRRGWRLFWRWKSHPGLGRPRLSAEVRELIATIARENPRWGSERIRGELRKLGIAVSKRSIQRYRRRGPAHPPSQTWRTFLANHAGAIWAAALCTVQMLTFETLYVLVLIAHGRRELVHVAVTAHPAAAWVWRQLVEATAWGRRPCFLLRNRDFVYGGDFGSRLAGLGVEQVLSPVRAPRANAVGEWLIGTLRRECLDHLLVLNERHLRAVFAEFAAFSNGARPHRTLGLETPLPAVRPTSGPIRARPVLGGLHHTYERAAWARIDFCALTETRPLRGRRDAPAAQGHPDSGR
jgi:transposase InsO family protein